MFTTENGPSPGHEEDTEAKRISNIKHRISKIEVTYLCGSVLDILDSIFLSLIFSVLCASVVQVLCLLL